MAIRRLRSVLRQYGEDLDKAGSRKVRRRFRALARATGAAREAETSIAWLEAQRPHLRRKERTGLNGLLRQRRATRRDGYGQARKAMRATFGPLRDRLLARLDGVPPGDATLEGRLPALVDSAVGNLAATLARVAGPEDGGPAHRARIRVKHLRYLLEPLEQELPDAKPVIRRLRTLQDDLGEWHDAHDLDALMQRALRDVAIEQAERLADLVAKGGRPSRKDERWGLAGLMARNRTRLGAAATRVLEGWGGDAGAALLHQARAIAPRSAPRADAESA